MNNKNKELTKEYNDLFNKIRVILNDNWNPIGIKDFTDCKNEYDQYISGVIKLLLQESITKEEIINHLNKIILDSLELDCNNDKNIITAEKLIHLKDDIKI